MTDEAQRIRMEAEIEYLTADLANARNEAAKHQITLLEYSGRLASAEAKSAMLEAVNRDMGAELATLRKPPARPWWRRWL